MEFKFKEWFVGTQTTGLKKEYIYYFVICQEEVNRLLDHR
jgi:hypothetical protein